MILTLLLGSGFRKLFVSRRPFFIFFRDEKGGVRHSYLLRGNWGIMGESAESFIRFVRPHWRRLHLVARRYAGDDHDARDMVQEGLLRAWRNFSLTEERTY